MPFTASGDNWGRTHATRARMKPLDILVATHGHCFDGMASAAVFTHLVRSLARRGDAGAQLTFRYKSCGYGPGMQQVPEAWLDGDESAILDFRYTPSPKVTWYFDHHVTAFASVAERDAALADPTAGEAARRVFFEPTYGSCAKLIADVARTRFAVELGPLEPLVRWADLIDSARFASAEEATNDGEPVLQLAAVVEHHGEGPFLNAMVPTLLDEDVAAIARSERIQSLFQPIAAARATFRDRVERKGRVRGAVVLVDLTDAPLEVAGKFVTYALYPACTYSVTVTRGRQHYKVSVGYNPWCGATRTHDIASICRRYNGGGHPAVGAFSFPLAEHERALAAAHAVVEELQR
jgi:hypothetical protein